jgi:hypothetical protein
VNQITLARFYSGVARSTQGPEAPRHGAQQDLSRERG